MTFEQWAANPMGENNMVISNREMFRALYRNKLDAILTREAGRVDYKLYVDGNDYIIHIKIPSEVITKFYYDTVIRFSTKNNTTRAEGSLTNYDVQFFSNDPSFVFTFAHAYLKNKLFIEDLTPKMSKKAITDLAKEKNPKNIVGYCKSIFFAYLIMKQRGLFLKSQYTTYGIKYSSKELLGRVEHADKKVDARIEEGKKALKEKAAKKLAKEKESPTQQNHLVKTTPVVNHSGVVGQTKTAGAVRTVKATKMVKTVGRTKRR